MRYSGSGLRETRPIRERVCFMVKIQNPLDLKKTQTLDLVLSVIFFFFLFVPGFLFMSENMHTM